LKHDAGVLSLALLLVVTAAPADFKLAVQDVKLTGLDPALSEGLTTHLGQSFKRTSVVTSRDIATILGVERQKQLMGCSDAASSCLAELGNALGVAGIVASELTKIGAQIQLNVRVLDPADGKVLAKYSEELGSIDDAFKALARGAAEIEAQLFPAAPGISLRTLGYVPLAAGVIAIGVGSTLYGMAASLYGQLTAIGKPGTITEPAASAAMRGQTQQNSGISLLIVGAVCVVAAIVMISLGGAH
jgi:hypothetical protein